MGFLDLETEWGLFSVCLFWQMDSGVLRLQRVCITRVLWWRFGGAGGGGEVRYRYESPWMDRRDEMR